MASVAGEASERTVTSARDDAPSGLVKRRGRNRMRGQSLVIFALSFTVLLSLVGLTVDSLRAFDMYARMQRAAEAGAVAGVLYMPTYFNTVRPGDTDSAVSRASREVVKNGFGTVLSATSATSCPAPVTSIEVAVCTSPTIAGDLQVYITEKLNLVLLSALGMGPTTLVASAQADSLPPIQLGSSSNVMGVEVACSPGGGSLNTNSSPCAINDTSQNHVQNFLVSMNGPASLKEAGDPYVYCAEGPALGSSTQASPSFNANGTDPGDPTNPFPSYTYNGFQTNHPQWSDVSSNSTTSLAPISNHCGVPTSGANPGNPDQQPSGYTSSVTDGTAHPGGYNYRIDIGSTVTAASVWVYNPVYIPQDTRTGCTPISPIPLDHFLDSGTCSGTSNTGVPIEPTFYQGPTGEGISNRFDGIHHDAPLFFFNTYFTLYKVNADYDRNSDTQLVTSNVIGQSEFDAYDATSQDLIQHGCTSGQVYDPNWGKKNGGADTPNTYHNFGSLVLGKGCVTPSTSTYLDVKCWLAWCKVSPTGGIGPGAYRLTVEAAGISSAGVDSSTGKKDYTSGPDDGYGSHAYAVAVCDSDTVPDAYGKDGCKDGSFGSGQFKNPQVVVSSWNNTDMTFQGTLAAKTPNKNYPQTACVTSSGTKYACLDAGCISTAFAGRTITLGLYNLAGLTAEASGVASGSLYVGLVPPAGGGTVTYPASVQSTLTTIDGVQAVQVASGSYSPFHGLWFLVTLTLPSNYTGLCNPFGGAAGNTGEWQIMYASSASYQIDDKITVAFALDGSPAHLVPMG